MNQKADQSTEAAYRWNSAYDLYWKDKHTRIDVYSYYPFGTPENVNAYDFTVRTLTNTANRPTGQWADTRPPTSSGVKWKGWNSPPT